MDVGSQCLEQVKSCKYIGSAVNGDNYIEEEIKEGIAVGIKTYYAYQKKLKSKLVSKKAKLKLCWTTIRPVTIYASETWVLKESMKRKLLITKEGY
jgi:hypothetical protein